MCLSVYLFGGDACKKGKTIIKTVAYQETYPFGHDIFQRKNDKAPEFYLDTTYPDICFMKTVIMKIQNRNLLNFALIKSKI